MLTSQTNIKLNTCLQVDTFVEYLNFYHTKYSQIDQADSDFCIVCDNRDSINQKIRICYAWQAKVRDGRSTIC